MPKFLVAVQHPTDYDGSKEGPQMMKDIDALNLEMIAAGARDFAGGLYGPAMAKSLRAGPDGQISIIDGPYLETKEHIGGFWILECADMEEALEWGKKAVVACRVPIEVRPFITLPPSS